ncbi:MAG: Cof-type HAD-IIB family hydrolase [Vicinamibacterales bacterium]
MVRLLGIDIDGTLLDRHGSLPADNAEAIREAVDAGIHVVLVTGRSYPFARPVAELLPAPVTLIVSNGAIERRVDGETLASRLLARDVAHRVLGELRDVRDAAALIFDRHAAGQIVFETMDWEHPDRRGYWDRNRPLIARATPLEEALTEDPIQVMFNGTVDVMRVVAGRVRDLACACAVSLTEYESRDFSLVDVTAPSATKGRALAWRAEQMGLTRDQVMAIGDNANDLGMLEFAGVPVVMGNAIDALRGRGWHETRHQDDAGVAHAIREFALGGTRRPA